MFEHLQIDFDSHNGIINLETAARDNHGNAKYSYNYNLNSANEVSVVQPEPVVEPVIETVEDVVPADVVDDSTVEDTEDVAPVISIVPDSETSPNASVEENVLSIEEQREVALKVVSFFICLILATLFILGVYHKIEQKSKPMDKRQTFFEFMSGQVEGDSGRKIPVYPQVNTRFAL